jgi:hypothetical protein
MRFARAFGELGWADRLNVVLAATLEMRWCGRNSRNGNLCTLVAGRLRRDEI